MIDPFEHEVKIETFPSLITDEEETAIKDFYKQNPQLKQKEVLEDIWVQTYTGKKFYPLTPKIEDICIEDIAHSLSMLCRFNGHTSKFYSLAEHSVLVSYLCNQENSLYGLCHDFSEFVLADFSAPLKHSGEFETYKKYEKNLQSIIYKRFGLLGEEPADVKKADLLMLATEAHNLMSPLHPEFHLKYNPLPIKLMCLPPNEAEKLLLDRFEELTSA